MALVKEMTKLQKEKPAIHEPVKCTYFSFQAGDDTYFQLDTYGSPNRDIPGKISQTLQFDRDSGLRLKALLEEHFK